jgi:predicted DNA-binding protein
MDTFLNVRIPNSLAESLKAEKARTHEPTSNFVRRAIEEALQKKEEQCSKA